MLDVSSSWTYQLIPQCNPADSPGGSLCEYRILSNTLAAELSFHCCDAVGWVMGSTSGL